MADLMVEWLAERFPEVTPREFYRCIFPEGELDVKGAMTKGKYTGIVLRIGEDGGGRKYQRSTLTDDLDAIDEAVNSDDFCVCRPLSYAGKRARAENARMLYAIAVDVDGLHTGPNYPVGLGNLWNRHIEAVKRIPRPTFIVCSGSGLHLYYVLDKPISLYEDATAIALQEYKRELTRLIWHESIVDIKEDSRVQQGGIYQGFRMPGTITKKGGRVKAFRTGDRVTFEYLESFAHADYRKAREAAKKCGKTKLAVAFMKWPDWGERRIVRGEKRGTWAVNRRVYDWWKEKILGNATVGHRYYCCMMLAIYAQKCGRYDPKHNPNPVTEEELEHDLNELYEHMESLTETEDNHFGLNDIQDAMEAYQERWITYPRASISYMTGIAIPANKRNGRKQADHLKLMNYVRDEINGNKEWNKVGNGRKSQFETVQMWRAAHPDGRKIDCIRETGLSKPTVYKHWETNAPADVEPVQAQPEREVVATDVARRLDELVEEIKGLEVRAEVTKLMQLIEAIEQMPDGAEKREMRIRFLELYETRWKVMFKMP